MQENKTKTRIITEEEMNIQREYEKKVKEIILSRTAHPKALVRTFGCQQNVADSQRIKGMLCDMGYDFTEDENDADFVLFNTCAVREHAEDRVIGNVGALKPIKEKRRDMIIALCGCMMQQEHVANKIKKSYPIVNLVFGTHVVHKLPQLLYETLTGDKRVFSMPDIDGVIAEGIPQINDGGVRGWLPIMYGCNNFCTYCVVPHVRGRERSRDPEDIERDFRDMLSRGIKDITVLGQNVNSYNGGISFADLLRRLDKIPGDYVLRFMTSHPKDCNEDLIRAMSECEHVERHIHLPVQSGSDRVLNAMNRHYTREHYLSLIDLARKYMPDVQFTSDIIVGFPGETHDEFLETVSLIKQVRYHSLYTFIFSPRVGTPAEKMDDPISRKEKGEWFTYLCGEQEKISSEISNAQIGREFRVLVEEKSRKDGFMYARTKCNQIVEIVGEEKMIGEFIDVKITSASAWMLSGEKI
mgnify:FL=1